MVVESETTSRRAFLRAGAATAGAAASVGSSGCLYLMGVRQRQARHIVSQPVNFASHADRITKQQATHIVRTRAQLVEAVATPNAIVWIPGSVTIDMTGGFMIPIERDVTIASNRALGGTTSTGGMIKTDGYDDPVFIHETGTLRVSGLRIKGPRTDYFDPWTWGADHEDYSARAFNAYGEAVIVDNCECYGWTFCAVSPGAKDVPTSGWFHHNSMHHNQMNHLGYALELWNGEHLIEWNYFSDYRHAIAGYGYPENSYEARFNVVGPPGGAPYGFAMDMHRLGEQDNFLGGNLTAGGYVDVHHNVFELTEHNALSISGVPTHYARFCDNWCATSKGGDGPGVPAVSAPAAASVVKRGNTFGETAVLRGRRWIKQRARTQTRTDTNSSPSNETESTTARRFS